MLTRSALAVTAALLLLASCTSAHTTSTTRSSGATSTGSPFDPTYIHDLSLTVDDDDLDTLVDTYEDTGEKVWVEATVTIDGSTYDNVGLRLKGNSSLRSASNTPPEDLPYRIRLDKFVDGQTHHGYTDIAVRSNSTDSSLNEAVALELLGEAGLPTQASSHTRFRVNDGDTALRLIVELPDDDAWQQATFGEAGALFKAESDGDWSYRGDNPDDYADAFEQKSGEDVADLGVIAQLLDVANEADDKTFAEELPRLLDVQAFADYLAMMDLLDNFDDISGPGNNSYLWWSASTSVFTVVPWDMNLAFGASPGGMGGPGVGRGGMGAGPGGAGGEAPGGQMRDGQIPGGPGQQSNALVQRFHANTEFEALYNASVARLRNDLFTSGRASEILDRRSQVLTDQATDLIDPGSVASDAKSIAAAFG